MSLAPRCHQTLLLQIRWPCPGPGVQVAVAPQPTPSRPGRQGSGNLPAGPEWTPCPLEGTELVAKENSSCVQPESGLLRPANCPMARGRGPGFRGSKGPDPIILQVCRLTPRAGGRVEAVRPQGVWEALRVWKETRHENLTGGSSGAWDREPTPCPPPCHTFPAHPPHASGPSASSPAHLLTCSHAPTDVTRSLTPAPLCTPSVC